jgi:hypothetical protein
MSKVLKALAASGLIVLSFGLAGCQEAGAPEKAPEEVIQEGIIKLTEATSHSYDVSVKGDLKGPNGEKPEKVTFDMKADGSMEATDVKDPKFNLSLTGEMMADADGGKGTVDFRLNKDAIFMNLKALSGEGAVTIPPELSAELIGKWWTMPIPPEALAEIAASVPATGSEEEMTPEQKKMKELVDSTKFFKDVKYIGSESVGGEPSHHYTAVMDQDAFTAFAVKASELQGQKISDAEVADMKQSMSMFDFSGDLYVGQNSGVLNKVKGVITFKASPDGDTPTGTITVEGMVSDLNKPVTVEVPADAQPIPMELLGGLSL